MRPARRDARRYERRLTGRFASGVPHDRSSPFRRLWAPTERRCSRRLLSFRGWRPIWGRIGAEWHPDDAAARRLLTHGRVLTRREAAELQACTLDEFAAMVRKVRDTSPGPDGLPYSVWGATVGGITSLYRVLIALTLGAQPPGWFNAALVIFIPKGVSTGEAYSATEAEYRPLTLADTAQKLVAKAVDGVFAEVASTTVHTAQTGFVKRRSMLESVLRIEGATEECLFDTRKSVGVILFEIEAAFPSWSHEWLWEALCSLRMPPWLIAAVKALYAEAPASGSASRFGRGSNEDARRRARLGHWHMTR